MNKNQKRKERAKKERQRVQEKENAITNGTYHGFVKKEHVMSQREIKRSIERGTIDTPLHVVMQNFMDM